MACCDMNKKKAPLKLELITNVIFYNNILKYITTKQNKKNPLVDISILFLLNLNQSLLTTRQIL